MRAKNLVVAVALRVARRIQTERVTALLNADARIKELNVPVVPGSTTAQTVSL